MNGEKLENLKNGANLDKYVHVTELKDLIIGSKIKYVDHDYNKVYSGTLNEILQDNKLKISRYSSIFEINFADYLIFTKEKTKSKKKKTEKSGEDEEKKKKKKKRDVKPDKLLDTLSKYFNINDILTEAKDKSEKEKQ